MQSLPQPLHVFARVELERRLYRDLTASTIASLPEILEQAEALIVHCFGCAEYLEPEELLTQTGLCAACQQHRQWERN